MKIGTLRKIVDLNDKDFALVLQALPAIRKEIQSFNNKVRAFIGENDCQYLTYDFNENGKHQAETAFKDWFEGFISAPDNKALAKQVEDLKKENQALIGEVKRLKEENVQLQLEGGRLGRQNESPFKKPDWFKDKYQWGPSDDWETYKVTSKNEMTPLDLLFKIVNDSTKGGL